MGFDSMLCASKTVDGFVREALAIEVGGATEAKLEEFIRSLEVEKGKVEVFKRELPLSMRLLGKVIEWLTEELEQCRRGRRPAVEELMPVKSKFDARKEVKTEADCRDKMKWMSSAQLWSHNNSDQKKTSEETDGREEAPLPESKSSITSGAFAPFKGLPVFPVSPNKEEKVAAPLPDLSLRSTGMKSSQLSAPVAGKERHGDGLSSKGVGRGPTTFSAAGAHLSQQCQQQQQQQQRKARRCWSPELHRWFVAALQQLGGAQVATPKQIRELMKVDGLTNDEVKSHLQKYRLHAQGMPSTASPGNWPAALVGGSWVSRAQYTSSQQCASQSGSPQGPLQLASSSRAVSVTGGDSCEEEDGKSESYGWK